MKKMSSDVYELHDGPENFGEKDPYIREMFLFLRFSRSVHQAREKAVAGEQVTEEEIRVILQNAKGNTNPNRIYIKIFKQALRHYILHGGNVCLAFLKKAQNSDYKYRNYALVDPFVLKDSCVYLTIDPYDRRKIEIRKLTSGFYWKGLKHMLKNNPDSSEKYPFIEDDLVFLSIPNCIKTQTELRDYIRSRWTHIQVKQKKIRKALGFTYPFKRLTGNYRKHYKWLHYHFYEGMSSNKIGRDKEGLDYFADHSTRSIIGNVLGKYLFD